MPDRIGIEMLKSQALFAGLGEDALEEVLRWSHRRRIAAGETLFVQGAVASAFYVLIAGHLKVTQCTPDGKQVVLHYIGPGCQFGCAALIGAGSYPGTTTAVEDSHAVGWSRTAIGTLMDRYPSITRQALAAVGRRLGETHDRLREISTENVERRVAHVLLHLVAENGRQVADGYEISFPISRQDIAEMAGTTLFTVSRILSGWEARGLLESSRRKIVVRQPGALSALADGQEMMAA